MRRFLCLIVGHRWQFAPGLLVEDPRTGRWHGADTCRRCGSYRANRDDVLRNWKERGE